MEKKVVPVWQKNTPNNFPELLDIWRKRYADLSQYHKKWKCLEILADEYNVNRSTIEIYLFAHRKNYQKKSGSVRWQNEKDNQSKRERIRNQSQRYMHLRRHIDEYIENSYACTQLGGSMTLEELSRNIELESGISLAPKTILGLNNRYEAKHGFPLIIETDGNPAEYFLNLDDCEHSI
ncbi:hypothetical protein DESC_530006 [Desulfosarcina cetonica]|uniref:hypothetical protein n=1 Tax=Desulfosarcina cetonica TaxID=90730 RepID=UPI0012EDCD71|nr:hypothetical protein [Desulfosarcina cetonica]VTR66892.1 hypothetical protein DESC_530006 [Desulfosarcina cetonica]